MELSSRRASNRNVATPILLMARWLGSTVQHVRTPVVGTGFLSQNAIQSVSSNATIELRWPRSVFACVFETSDHEIDAYGY